MSNNQEQFRHPGQPTPLDIGAIFAALEKINARLVRLEKSIPFTTEKSSFHPSLEQFPIAEATMENVSGKKEKACTFEPNGKPCDHCGMCSSRGF